jgi:hypothetical protein
VIDPEAAGLVGAVVGGLVGGVHGARRAAARSRERVEKLEHRVRELESQRAELIALPPPLLQYPEISDALLPV